MACGRIRSLHRSLHRSPRRSLNPCLSCLPLSSSLLPLSFPGCPSRFMNAQMTAGAVAILALALPQLRSLTELEYVATPALCNACCVTGEWVLTCAPNPCPCPLPLPLPSSPFPPCARASTYVVFPMRVRRSGPRQRTTWPPPSCKADRCAFSSASAPSLTHPPQHAS